MPGWNLQNSYLSLPPLFFSELSAQPVPSPKLLLLNERLVDSLGLESSTLRSDHGAQIFSGQKLPPGFRPLAQAYAGHQFGHFTRLGDGRALLLGEHITPEGLRVDIQLKGSGITPYSRGGDGKATLGPMLREYLISEAMAALGLPTTRSLAVTTTGEDVYRDAPQPGAILTRVASSHIRVGTFEYAAAFGGLDDLKALADYTLSRHAAHLLHDPNPYLSFLKDVTHKQAQLISQWMTIGFIHGVMNTDNMAISGETLDYGPCAFMDQYDPSTVFSSIDHSGRYAYGRQPQIAQWNLARFAETLLPLLDPHPEKASELAREALNAFADTFAQLWRKYFREKLGLVDEVSDDLTLIQDLLTWMSAEKADFTLTFRSLSCSVTPEHDKPLLFDPPSNWKERWLKRLKQQPLSLIDAKKLMLIKNPALIPRNHLVEEALDSAVNNQDIRPFCKLLEALQSPFSKTADMSNYAQLPPPRSEPYHTFCGT